MTGFVYFIRCGEFVKIGFSANPSNRLRYLQTATPFDFSILGVHPGTKRHEKRLHAIFSHLHHRLEWFRADEAILEIAKNGLPPLNLPPPPAMNGLGVYLSTNKIEPADFAKRAGVTREALRLWLSRQRTPRQKAMARIVEMTDGSVTPNDFLPTAAPRLEPTEAAE